MKRRGGMLYKYADLKRKGYAHKDIERLVDQRIMFKIEKGVYSNRRNVTELSTFMIKHPKVIFTLESAFYYYGMTDKRPEKYVVVTKKPAWRIVDVQIKQYFMDPAIYDIGVTKLQINNTWIPIYDRERMLIELVRYRKKLDPEYYKEIRDYYHHHPEKINMKKLKGYLDQFVSKKKLTEVILTEIL